ncbi:MAG TPA: AIR synthase related protein [Actinomycetes bacterium]|jgi:hypothetical protein|nr:AIR synthase related protein [Actinomycetes bacterium]
MGAAALLEEVVNGVRAHAGLRGKSPLGLVTEVLGPTDWRSGPGDDGAVVSDGACSLVVGGEALLTRFVEADPFAAGVAAVLTNVNDLAAMGAWPLAIVDTVVASEPLARRALEGMRHASELYRVPVVGGHLTIRDGPPGISAFGLGRAARVLSVRAAAPGQTLLVACCLDGTMREDFPFFASLPQRGAAVADDVRLLPRVAESGACVAAKDVSMAGLLGSLAMLLEYGRLGATVDLDALPRPAGVSLARWLVAFPAFAFLLCAPPGKVDACRAPFLDRGLACEPVAVLDGSGALRARLGGAEALVLDLHRETVTGLGTRARVPR